jgi:hypothetical protein
MRCCGKLEGFLLGLMLLFAAGMSRAADIVVEEAWLAPEENGYSLSADFRLKLNRRLEEAVNKGLVLYFAADFELTRSRWYWFDEKVAQHSRVFQLSYHALTRQYRLSSGALHQAFFSLEDAVQVLSRLRHWRVLEKDEVSADVDYVASTRLRFDPSQMAKPFQINALSNRDWSLSSDWLAWDFSVAVEAPPEAGDSEAEEAR